MRKFLFVLFLFSFLSTSAQDWPEKETWWVYQFTDFGNLRYQFLNVIGDTIINSQDARIIQETIFKYNVNPETGEKILLSSEISENPILILNSNDSIYYRYLDEWRFLYHFDLDVGDEYDLIGIDSTICYQAGTQQEYSLPVSEKVQVKEVVSYDIQNYPVEEIIFEESEFWYFGARGIVKNIGPFENFIPKPKCVAINYHYGTDGLRCFYSPMIGEVLTGESTAAVCQEMQIVHSIDSEIDDYANRVKVFPNPATNHLNIELGNHLEKDITIFNTSGVVCFKNDQFQNTVDISELHKGFYYIHIKTETAQYFSSFIKI